MTSRPLTCWVVSDGRRGIENQALGLAEACARFRPLDIKRHVIESGGAFKAASPKIQLAMRSDPFRYGLPAPYPDIAIGCGRQAIAPLMALKKAAGDNIFTVYVQDPRIEAESFDLVVAPEHDKVSGENVLKMIGSPNRITRTELIAQVLNFQERLAALPMPRVAMLIGGPSKAHKLTEDVHAAHMKAAQDTLASGRSLLLTTSRRTPDWAVDAYRQFADGKEDVWYYESGEPNPYLAFLGGADTILVTEDSTNMLTDACSTGKSVFTLPMGGRSGKFQKLYDSLSERCHVRPYDARFKTETYAPLDETSRVAQKVLQRYSAKS